MDSQRREPFAPPPTDVSRSGSGRSLHRQNRLDSLDAVIRNAREDTRDNSLGWLSTKYLLDAIASRYSSKSILSALAESSVLLQSHWEDLHNDSRIAVRGLFVATLVKIREVEQTCAARAPFIIDSLVRLLSRTARDQSRRRRLTEHLYVLC